MRRPRAVCPPQLRRPHGRTGHSADCFDRTKQTTDRHVSELSPEALYAPVFACQSCVCLKLSPYDICHDQWEYDRKTDTCPAMLSSSNR
jgi:hypothetical protein